MNGIGFMAIGFQDHDEHCRAKLCFALNLFEVLGGGGADTAWRRLARPVRALGKFLPVSGNSCGEREEQDRA
jgi:hypothetical protein